MKKLLVLILFVAACSPVTTATLNPSSAVLKEIPLEISTIGADPLGIKRNPPYWNCQAFIDSVRSIGKLVPGGTLTDRTFGDSNACLEAWLDSGTLASFRAHLLNANAISAGHGFGNEYLPSLGLNSPAAIDIAARTNSPKLMNLICQRAQEVENWAQHWPAIKFLVSGMLEHSLSQQGAINIANKVSNCAPSCAVVDNPINPNKYPPIPNVTRERHGTSVWERVSLDGAEASDIDQQTWKNNNQGHQLLEWGRCYNGRAQNGNWVQANQRIHFCDADHFNLYAQLTQPDEPKPESHPSICQTFKEYPANNYIWKPLSEEYFTGNKRDGRPVNITYYRSNRINILGQHGEQLGYLGYYGTFITPGMYRYYLGGYGSGQSAYQIGQQAKQKTGSSWVYLPESNGKCWLIYPYRRNGLMR